MKKLTASLGLISLFIFLIICCTEDKGPDLYGGDFPMVPAIGDIPERVELPQNWDRETRDLFWWTSQGAEIIPYSWFVWLEMANDTTLFRSAEHMEELRYMPMASSSMNPGGLPIGFTISKSNRDNDNWVGLTCAACHTNQLDYEGTKMLIEGAPTLANFPLFFNRLVDAMAATNSNTDKFNRFASRVLGDQYSKSKADSLRNYLEEIALTTADRRLVNSLDSLPPDFTSYARLDAFGEIQNAGTAFALHDINNRNIPSAPVSYPFLWGTHQSDVVQWNASAKNTPVIGPLVRNVGEVVGVFGNLSIDKKGDKIDYSSTVNFHNLGELEKWVKEMGSPAWPEEYLPPIDVEQAARGNLLYNTTCLSCHSVIPRDSVPYINYVASKVLVNLVGTDTAMAVHAANYTANTLALEGTKQAVLFGDPFPQRDTAIKIPVNGVIGLILKDPLAALEAGLIPYQEHIGKKTELGALVTDINNFIEEHKKDKTSTQEELNNRIAQLLGQHLQGNSEGLVYKARPLNGIWATAPYLHNGSVPNLWELLQDPKSRVDTFWVGSREFDPEVVGFETGKKTGLNFFNVHDAEGNIQLGNSNLGHPFGTTWTTSQKWAVIEYLKTL